MSVWHSSIRLQKRVMRAMIICGGILSTLLLVWPSIPGMAARTDTDKALMVEAISPQPSGILITVSQSTPELSDIIRSMQLRHPSAL